MFSVQSLLTFLVAGTALAVTPPGFEPSSNKDLELAFCDNLAINGANIPQEETEMSPAVGTSQQLSGTFTVILVDTDVPASTPGGETRSFLHLIQTGLTSANVTAPIAGKDMFELENKDDIQPLAAFIQPNPPNEIPTTHRYTSLLLNNTDNDKAMAVLRTASKTRLGFNVADVVAQSGADVVAATFFTVTNPSAVGEKVEIREMLDDMEAKRKLHIKRLPMATTTIQNPPAGASVAPAQTITLTPNQPGAPPAGTNSPVLAPGQPPAPALPPTPGQSPAPGQPAVPGVGNLNPIIIVPNQPAAPGAGNNSPIVIIPGQPAAPGAPPNQPIVVVPNQPAAPPGGAPAVSTQTIIVVNPNQPAGPAPTGAPVPGQPPRFSLNTTLPVTQPPQLQQGQQTIIVRLSQIQATGGFRNVTSFTFLTPKIPGSPSTTAPANPTQAVPDQQQGGPFQNGTQPTTLPDTNAGIGAGAGQPATTGTAPAVPPPTSGALSLKWSGDAQVTLAVMGFSVLVAAFAAL